MSQWAKVDDVKKDTIAKRVKEFAKDGFVELLGNVFCTVSVQDQRWVGQERLHEAHRDC